MLRFPYLEEPLLRSAPPSLPASSVSRWRPLVPVRVIGPKGDSRLFLRCLVDPGSDDTIFPLDLAALIGIQLGSLRKYSVRWRGQGYTLKFAAVELELTDSTETWRWPTVIGFSDAPIRYPLLGIAGSLQFMNVTFHGQEQVVTFETNTLYPGDKA